MTITAAEQRRTNSIEIEPSEDFVLTEAVQSITDRALAYLDAGYSIHLAGPAGTGKTTLAFHIAAQLGNEITLMHGNDEFGSSDMVGKDSGYTRSSLVDNYVSSVLKTEEKLEVAWTDNRLTTCCERGQTLIYDEFNRSPPEANNIFLSILEEGILDIPGSTSNQGYLDVHPSFRAIMTSNPEEYAGVHRAQDALLDRLVTINIDHYDAETETNIIVAKSGIHKDYATWIVDVVRLLREVGPTPTRPTIRAGISIAKVCAKRNVDIDINNDFVRAVCQDILLGAIGQRVKDDGGVTEVQLTELMRAAWSELKLDRRVTTRNVSAA